MGHKFFNIACKLCYDEFNTEDRTNGWEKCSCGNLKLMVTKDHFVDYKTKEPDTHKITIIDEEEE